MIITPPILARLGAVVFVAVLLELSFFSSIPLLGTVPVIVPVVVVALGLLGGAVPGAVSGFAAGLLLDASLAGTLGASSLALMTTGYLAGRWRETYDIVSAAVPPVITGLLTGLAATATLAIHLTLGVEASISVLVVREILAQALMGGILAVAVFPVVRRVLRPALVDGERRRTRRRSRGSFLEAAS